MRGKQHQFFSSHGGDKARLKHKFKHSKWFGEFVGKRRIKIERGEIRYLILDVLKEKSRHGYEIIQRLEEKTDGQYRPSPGSIYPTLQLLEELELVKSQMDGNKRNYSLTEKGKVELEEQKDMLEDVYEAFGRDQAYHYHEIFEAFHDPFKTLIKTVSGSIHRGQMDQEKTQKIKTIIQDSIQQINEVLKQN